LCQLRCGFAHNRERIVLHAAEHSNARAGVNLTGLMLAPILVSGCYQ
jgi:hypothetical protein